LVSIRRFFHTHSYPLHLVQVKQITKNNRKHKMVTVPKQPQKQGGGQPKKPRNRRRRRKRSGDRGTGLARNPGSRRRDTGLDLTRSQFTATSPLNMFTVERGSTPGGVRVRGRELIGAVSSVAASTGAFALLNIAAAGGTGITLTLTPSSFPRLQSYTNIYEYFKFHRADVLFQANQPTTAAGEIVASVDYDVDDTAPANTVAMMRNISASMANIYSDASLQILGELSRLPKFKTGIAGQDNDQNYQAVVYMAQEGVTASAGQGLGYVIIEYDVEFFTPQ